MIAGFGLNDRAVEKDIGLKMYADVPVYSAICGNGDLDAQVGCVPGREALLIDWQYHQRDTCRGDSGGPAFIRSRDNVRYFLVAVTSRAVDQSGEALCGPGGVYTLVTPAVVAWLRSLGVTTVVEGLRAQ
jgi:Trypsin